MTHEPSRFYYSNSPGQNGKTGVSLLSGCTSSLGYFSFPAEILKMRFNLSDPSLELEIVLSCEQF
jgi:hypothetical protein